MALIMIIYLPVQINKSCEGNEIKTESGFKQGPHNLIL